MTGNFGNVDLGQGPLTSAGNSDIVVARLDGNGTTTWSKQFGGAALQQSTGVVVDKGGAIYVTGISPRDAVVW